MRDALIGLFEREFIEPQESLGMTLVGQFRDLGDADKFVWIRRFEDMPAREYGLRSFYGGPTWKMHRAAANATMIDSDDVFLLRPARPDADLPIGERSTNALPPSRVFVSTAYLLGRPAEESFVATFEQRMRPVLESQGARVIGVFVTERSPNNFPALPVREGVNAFVAFTAFADEDEHRRNDASLDRSRAWGELREAIATQLVAPIERRVLAPTPRSRLR